MSLSHSPNFPCMCSHAAPKDAWLGCRPQRGRKDAPGTPNVAWDVQGTQGILPPPSPGTPPPPPPHSQRFPNPAKQASSITPPGTGAFLMLNSIASHNDSLAGVPGCPPLPKGALIYGWEARSSGGVDAGRRCPVGGISSVVPSLLFSPLKLPPRRYFSESRSTLWCISLIQPPLNQ